MANITEYKIGQKLTCLRYESIGWTPGKVNYKRWENSPEESMNYILIDQLCEILENADGLLNYYLVWFTGVNITDVIFYKILDTQFILQYENYNALWNHINEISISV